MKKKIHILQVVGSMNTGGAEVMIMDLFRYISKDFQFDFLVNYKKKLGIPKGDFDDEIISRKAVIKHIHTQWDIGYIRYIRQFKTIYNALGKPEVVHIHLNAKSGIIALAAKLAGAKKIIVHSHANIVFRGHPLKVMIYKIETFFQKILIDRFATDYWGASLEACRSLFYKKREKDFVVINNAIDVEKFQAVTQRQIDNFKSTLNIKNGTFVFGNVGRIVRHKRVDFILDILSDFQKKEPDFIFFFAGRIDDQKYFEVIRQKIEKYNLSNKVTFLGNRDDTPILYNAMDVFIAPALKEGFGLVALEAQAAGLPCLLYKGFPETVDMGLGLVKFYDDFNISAWSRGLSSNLHKKLHDKRIIKIKIGLAGFNIKNNVKTVESLYNIM